MLPSQNNEFKLLDKKGLKLVFINIHYYRMFSFGYLYLFKIYK